MYITGAVSYSSLMDETTKIVLTTEDPEGGDEVQYLGVFDSREAARAWADQHELEVYEYNDEELDERLEETGTDSPVQWDWNDADSDEAEDEGATGSSAYCYRMHEVVAR